MKYNVTWTGDCPVCGASTTVTGLGSPEAPIFKLGEQSPEPFACIACGTTFPLTCVGLCLEPFVAREEEDEDDEDDEEEEGVNGRT